MSGPGPTRRRYCVGVVKIPQARRDVARAVLPDAAAVGERGYRSIMGGDTPDDDDRFPVGEHTAYTLELTEAEAEAFAAARNARYVQLDLEATLDRGVGRPAGTPEIPTLASLTNMRARYVDLRRWHGRDVRVCIADQGTTAAVRDAMGFTLVNRTITSGDTMPAGREIFTDAQSHGCLVAPNGVPAGGLLLDAVLPNAAGTITTAAMATSITWAADQGAKVMNMSVSFTESPGKPENYQQAILDAVIYAAGFGLQIVFSAGNDDQADLNYPASICRTRTNVHSSIGWDEATDRRGLYSNYHADGSGCAPGTDVASLTITAAPTLWNGTSASSPHMAQLIARGATGGTYTTAQVAAALRANPRDTGAGASQQGKGAWDLHRALAALGGVPGTPTAAGVAAPSFVEAVGLASNVNSYNVGLPPGVQVGDVRIIFLASSVAGGTVVPAGWRVLTDATYRAEYELARGLTPTPGPTRVRVLAKPYTATEPATTNFAMAADTTLTWFSVLGALTVRVAGGFNPEQFVPTVRFGVGASIPTEPVLPNTTNDLLVCGFVQRHPTSPTGTLSTPTGLTSRGFWRPSAGTTGYLLRLATAQLASGARTAAYTSTSDSATGTWCSVALTVPGGVVVPTVTQSEPAGPPGAFLPWFP